MEEQNLEHCFRRYLTKIAAKPGDRLLPEMKLAEKFQVSRGDIRKLLNTMSHVGVLERRPRAGTVIKRFCPQTVSNDLAFRFQMAGLDPADAQEARLTIETAILPLIIRRITPSNLARLQALNECMEANADCPVKADQLDRKFHLELLAACGNETLRAFGGVISGLFHPELRDRWHTPDFVRRATGEHRDLLEAIQSEDVERAAKMVSAAIGRTL